MPTKRHGRFGFQRHEQVQPCTFVKGWRLITNTQGLATRVLKAKYYRNTSFLEAKLGWNPSLTWRSLWGTRKLLRAGTRWRVGDGSNVKVLTDKWVPSIRGFIPTPINGGLGEETMVKELINERLGRWQTNRVKDFSSQEEAEAILQIPLSRFCKEDKIVWSSDVKGHYTVKSGYKMLCIQDDQIVNTTTQTDQEILRSIWKAKVPQKVRIFAWKLFYDLLPLAVKLQQRRMNVDLVCAR